MTYSSYRIQRNRPMVVLNGKPIRCHEFTVTFPPIRSHKPIISFPSIQTSNVADITIDDSAFFGVCLTEGLRPSGRRIFYADFLPIGL